MTELERLVVETSAITSNIMESRAGLFFRRWTPGVLGFVLWSLVCFAAGSHHRDGEWQKTIGPCSLPETKYEVLEVFMWNGVRRCANKLR